MLYRGLFFKTIFIILAAFLIMGLSPSVVRAADDAQAVSDIVPATMATYQVGTVYFTMQNTGTTTWRGEGVGDPTQLLLLDSTFGTQYMGGYMPAGTTVPPGGQYTFAIYITAPSTPNTYNLRVRMIHQGVTWFGPTISKSITVTQVPDSAQIISSTVPAGMAPGATQNVSITMRMETV